MRPNIQIVFMLLHFKSVFTSEMVGQHFKIKLQLWLTHLQTYEGFIDVVASNIKIEKSNSKSRKKLFLLADLREANFTGTLDLNTGLPNDLGTVNFSKDEKGISTLSCSIKSITAKFSAGYINGPSLVQFINGTILFNILNRNIERGLRVMTTPLDNSNFTSVQLSENGPDARTIWHWQNNVALYTPSSFQEFDPILLQYLGDPFCEPVVIANHSKVHKATILSYGINEFSIIVPEFTHSGLPLDGYEIPSYLKDASLEDKLAILGRLHAKKCEQETVLPFYTSVFKNRNLLQDDSELLLSEEPRSRYIVAFQEIHSNRLKHLKSRDEECASILNFIPLPKQGSIYQTMFASYPGSGSKWLFYSLEESTGLGSMHGSYYHKNNGSLPIGGLLLKTHHSSTISQLGVKQRYPSTIREFADIKERLWNIQQTRGMAILILRNPFEAILSWFNHILSRNVYSNGSLSQSEIEKVLESKKNFFQATVEDEINHWKIVALDWLHFSSDLIVVHFEHMKEDFVSQLRRIHEFLKVPISTERLDCLARFPINFAKRTQLLDFSTNPFTKKTQKIVREAMKEVDQILVDKGHQELPKHLYKYLSNREEL